MLTMNLLTEHQSDSSTPVAGLLAACSEHDPDQCCHIWTAHRRVQICGQANGIRIVSESQIPWPDCSYDALKMNDLQVIHQQMRDVGAFIILDSPQLDQWHDIAQAQLCRFICCQSDQDFARWDSILSTGVPIYAICGTSILVDCDPRPSAVIQALAFGCFYGHDDLAPVSVEEGRSACAWTFAEDVHCSIIGHTGFQLDQQQGTHISWQDRGTEGYVRMHASVTSATGTRQAWTQPRMIGIRPSS